ncbi:ATP-binding cassette domain-containing protein [bacterium]|nr:ATP-binding cassette domain-containing protein [bacterium]
MPEYPIIEFKDIEKSYLDKKPLFSKINTKIKQGEFLFLTGVSGAGKSTMFKLILGLENPTAGQIFFNGKEVNSISKREMPDHRRNIGMVFQDYKLLPKKTVEENIAIPLLIQGYSSSKINQKILDIARRIRIEHQLKQSIQSLSGGEQQLVAIARASIHSPLLILADEPTANLDQKMAYRIIEMLLSLNEDGITVIIATHDVNLIKSHEKRILLIKRSGLVEVH